MLTDLVGTNARAAHAVKRWPFRPLAASTAQDRAETFSGAAHGRVAGRAGVVFGQRAVSGAEPQREGQRLVAVAHLGTGVDVEQPDVFEQLAGAGADGVLDR